jgi:hypothetical protein
MKSALPRILFFNINGVGLGHMSFCLAYANRLRGRAEPVFFSLASALEMIHEMGFEADYLVSPPWSRARSWDWNQQLALRLGLMLERVRPEIIVFDGTWPFHGLFRAAEAYGTPKLVWSTLTMYRRDFPPVPVSELEFDLVIQLGELGSSFHVERASPPGRKVTIPPLTVLKDDELLERDAARAALGLDREGRYALLYLGSGNNKDVAEVASGLVEELHGAGLSAIWARPPISLRDVPLPKEAVSMSVYPLARYMRAFDVFVGAAGYATCCEIVQTGVPSLLVPNALVADDQIMRARMVAERVPAIVSACETQQERADAVAGLLSLSSDRDSTRSFDLSGAERGADEILALIEQRRHD